MDIPLSAAVFIGSVAVASTFGLTYHNTTKYVSNKYEARIEKERSDRLIAEQKYLIDLQEYVSQKEKEKHDLLKQLKDKDAELNTRIKRGTYKLRGC